MRAGLDGHKQWKGSKIHSAVDTGGNLLALPVTVAHENDRSQVEKLAKRVQEVTGDQVEIDLVDQGYTGEEADAAETAHGIELVVKHNPPKRGFVLLPRR